MATFSYTVRDRTGKLQKGRLNGETQDAVSVKLRQMGYIVLALDENLFGALANIKVGDASIKTKAVTIFARQFATMINAGLSLTKCLAVLGQQTESKPLREIIAQLGQDVEAGLSLSEAMAKHPKAFPPIFVNMVRAGETGGVLDEVLSRVAAHLEREAALKAKIKSAMAYPVVLGVLVIGVLAIMMVFVVPVFQKMFSDMGGTLPAPTQLLVDISNTVRSPMIFVIIGVVAALIWVFRRWKRTETGRYAWDAFRLRMPVFGSLVRKLALARFTRTFGTLVSAGVPILSSLDIVGETAGNAVVERAVQQVRAAVKEGETIAKPLSEAPVFPSMLVQMIAVGEETGAMDAMLNKVADFYDEEVSTAVDGLTALIEPLAMALLGGMVGFIVISLYLPMFNVISLINK